MMDDHTDDIEDFMRDLKSWALSTWTWAKAAREPMTVGRTGEPQPCPSSGPIPG